MSYSVLKVDRKEFSHLVAPYSKFYAITLVKNYNGFL